MDDGGDVFLLLLRVGVCVSARFSASLLLAGYHPPTSAVFSAVLGDLVLRSFIVPAIIDPESHGLVLDTPVSETGRRNLLLVARVLRDLARGTVEAEAEPFMMPVYRRLRSGTHVVGVRAFFDRLVDIPPGARGLAHAPGAVNFRGRRHAVLLAEAQLWALVTWVVKGAHGRLPADHPFCAGAVAPFFFGWPG